MTNPLVVPVDGKGVDWPRRVANAINALLGRQVATQAEIDAIKLRLDALETP